jgi:hypothetical protein
MMESRKRSALARQDKLSFFNELDPAQLSTYSAAQIEIILKQRDELHKNIRSTLLQTSIHQDERRRTSLALFDKPWVPAAREECQYKVCPFCRQNGSDRAYLSLNGTADDDISPSAAVGFGFHMMGERPVVDVRIVRDIGCRPVPLVGAYCELFTDSYLICLQPDCFYDYYMLPPPAMVRYTEVDFINGESPGGLPHHIDDFEQDEYEEFPNDSQVIRHGVYSAADFSRSSKKIPSPTTVEPKIQYTRQGNIPTQRPWTPPPTPSFVENGLSDEAQLSRSHVDGRRHVPTSIYHRIFLTGNRP